MTRPPLPSIAQLAGAAWAQLRRQWLTWLKLVAIPVSVYTVAGLLVSILTPWGPAWLGLYALTIVAHVASFVATLAIILTLSESLSAQQSWAAALRRWRAIVWLMAISFVFYIGGLALMVVPGLVYFTWFIFDAYFLADEDARGLGAMWRSREMVRGSFWRTLGHIGLMFLLVVVVGAFLSPLTPLPGMLFGVGWAGVAATTVIAVATNLIFGAAVMPFILAYFYEMYRIRREVVLPPQEPLPRRRWLVLLPPLVGCAILASLLILRPSIPTPARQLPLGVGASQSVNDAPSTDALQLVRLNVLKLAVNEYRNDRGSYPARLLDLSPDYIKANAVDLASFSYTLGESGQAPRLCATMSAGEPSCVSWAAGSTGG